MSIDSSILQMMVDAGGAIDKRAFKAPSPSWHTRMHELKERGYLVCEYRVSEAGREFLANYKPRDVRPKPPKPKAPSKFARGMSTLSGVWQRAMQPEALAYPLASTNDQINDIKRKAAEDRSFGFESASQRMRTTDVSDC